MARLPEFRKRLRKLQAKKKISNRELLGLFFDLHEMLAAIGEEARREMEMMEIISRNPLARSVGVSPEEFFQGVKKRGKKTSKEKPEEKHPKGQYL